MPIKLDLPKDLVKPMIEQAISLRERQIKASSNPIIKEALEKEAVLLEAAKNTITEIK